MQSDAVNFVLAIVFTAGCIMIHVCRHRLDDATVLIVQVMAGLLNLSGAAMLAPPGPRRRDAQSPPPPRLT